MKSKIIPLNPSSEHCVPTSSANWRRLADESPVLDVLILLWLSGWGVYATALCLAQVHPAIVS